MEQTCPLCGYIMEPWDECCPKCKDMEQYSCLICGKGAKIICSSCGNYICSSCIACSGVTCNYCALLTECRILILNKNYKKAVLKLTNFKPPLPEFHNKKVKAVCEELINIEAHFELDCAFDAARAISEPLSHVAEIFLGRNSMSPDIMKGILIPHKSNIIEDVTEENKRHTETALKEINAKPLCDDIIVSDLQYLTHKLNNPKLYYSDELNPNALALGLGKNDGRIVLTKGLLNILDRDEINAVLAHELGHIKGNDIVGNTILSFKAGLSAESSIAFSTAIGTSIGIGFSLDNNSSNDLFGWVFGGAISLIGGSIAASNARKKITDGFKCNEYAADSFSAKVLNPRYLISALEIMDDNQHDQWKTKHISAVSHACIVNTGFTNSVIGIVTHPSTETRISALENL
jgi:hypothetical protein